MNKNISHSTFIIIIKVFVIPAIFLLAACEKENSEVAVPAISENDSSYCVNFIEKELSHEEKVKILKSAKYPVPYVYFKDSIINIRYGGLNWDNTEQVNMIFEDYKKDNQTSSVSEDEVNFVIEYIVKYVDKIDKEISYGPGARKVLNLNSDSTTTEVLMNHKNQLIGAAPWSKYDVCIEDRNYFYLWTKGYPHRRIIVDKINYYIGYFRTIDEKEVHIKLGLYPQISVNIGNAAKNFSFEHFLSKCFPCDYFMWKRQNKKEN